MQASGPRPFSAPDEPRSMRVQVRTSTHAKASRCTSASTTPADSRAALPKMSWKRYQKQGLPETRVLRLQGQDEVLFQFCNSKGWCHAEHVGTITPYQAWLALKKLGREDYDVTKANLGFALWEDSSASSRASPRSDTNGIHPPEQNGAAFNGAQPQHLQNDRHSLADSEAADADVEDVHAVDGTMWDQPALAEEQVYDDVCEDRPDQRGQKRRFWQFNDSRPEPEPLLQPSRKQKAPKRKGSHSTQQPKVVDMSASSLSSRSAKAKSAQLTTEQAASPTEEGIEGPYTTPDGWTVINDSLVNSASRGAEEDILPGSVGKANVSLQRAYMVAAEGAQDVDSSTGVNDSGSQSIEPGKAWPEAVTFAEEQLPEATAAARFKAPERIQSTAKQKESSSLQDRLGLAAKRFLQFRRDRVNGLRAGGHNVLRLAMRSAQVAFWAALFLLRKAAWALVGQPGPPKVHASPQIAQLCRCASLQEAKSLGRKLGYNETGQKANPLEDLPRWRVESLVGTFVLDMSLYRRALTAPSAVSDSITASYERLEYLGDGILEGIIRQFIYSRWPEVSEHAMCAMVSGLVSGRTLHDFARGLHLQRCLALDLAAQWEGKYLSGWADGKLADSFEALLAALFMDRGFNAAKALIMRLIENFVELERLPYNRDYKGILGNILSIGKIGRPRYRCRLVHAPEVEAQKFSLVPSKAALPGSEELLWEASVQLRRGTWAAPMVLGKAYDIRRATAEQQAARAALQSLGLQIKEMSLVEADQISMAQMASNMPGLTILKGAVEESSASIEDCLLEEVLDAADTTPQDAKGGLADELSTERTDSNGLTHKKPGKKEKFCPSTESLP